MTLLCGAQTPSLRIIIASLIYGEESLLRIIALRSVSLIFTSDIFYFLTIISCSKKIYTFREKYSTETGNFCFRCRLRNVLKAAEKYSAVSQKHLVK
jgi:hypothetical protein